MGTNLGPCFLAFGQWGHFQLVVRLICSLISERRHTSRLLRELLARDDLQLSAGEVGPTPSSSQRGLRRVVEQNHVFRQAFRRAGLGEV